MRRIYKIDESFFDKIDTAYKAYYLGFLYADGYHGEKRYRIVLSLQERDSYILENVKKYLGSNHPIATSYKNCKRGNQITKILEFGNKKLSLALLKLGCYQGKSLTVKFPTEEQVPKHLLSHFVRGYFDGDGCVSYSNNNLTTGVIRICVSLDFGTELVKLLKMTLDINAALTKAKDNKIHVIVFSGRKKVVKFLDWIYQEKTDLFLTRKYDKYLSLKGRTSKWGAPTSSKYIGVYYNKRNKNFEAYAHRGYKETAKKIHLGCFKNEDDAAKAYNKYAIENNWNRDLNEIPSSNTNLIQVIN